MGLRERYGARSAHLEEREEAERTDVPELRGGRWGSYLRKRAKAMREQGVIGWNPGDESRRDRERRARAEGGVEAEAARIASELRTGRLSSVAVEWAAVLGDPAAVADPRHVRGWTPGGPRALHDSLDWVMHHASHGYRDLLPAVREAFTRSWERVSEHQRQDHGYMQNARFAGAQNDQWQNAFRDLRLAYEHSSDVPWDGAFDVEAERQAAELIALLLGRSLP